MMMMTILIMIMMIVHIKPHGIGDNNTLPDWYMKDGITMLKNIASLEAQYKIMVADALVEELNKEK